MAITKERIFQVADELDAAGQNPTLAAVRKTLDGGSYTTISEAMKEWRAQKASDNSLIQEPPPPGVMEKLAEVGGEIWTVAMDLANGRLASEREALELARNEMELARQEAVELADQLSGELDESKKRIAAMEQQIADLQAEGGGLRGQLAKENDRAEKAEARKEEVEKRAAELRKELDHAHEMSDKFQTDKDLAVAAEKQAKEEAAQLRGRLEGMELALNKKHSADQEK